jgi:cyclic pyranopterin phosphate synthase
MNDFSHVDQEGNARMVNVSHKLPQERVARARGEIHVSPLVIKRINQNQVQKGDVLTVAKIAGIQAAKRTFELIPLCHSLPLSHVQVDWRIGDNSIIATSEVGCVAQTGVEMEALTAVSVALLTVYDMCKAVDKEMVIGQIALLDKTKKPVV